MQISCAIAAYARLSINPFKNMISNKLYYSDTDSLVLENKLTDNIVGNELGQWKLEAIIKKGIFIRPKLYSYYTEDGSLKKVASGVDSNKLTYEDYEAMANGNSVTVNETKLSINWENLEIITFNLDITLKVDCEDNPLNVNQDIKLKVDCEDNPLNENENGNLII